MRFTNICVSLSRCALIIFGAAFAIHMDCNILSRQGFIEHRDGITNSASHMYVLKCSGT